MKLKQVYYWARPLRSVGAVKEGQLQIVEVSECRQEAMRVLKPGCLLYAKDLGFVGVELDQDYYNIAKARVGS